MSTIPARLARKAQSSGSWQVSNARSRALYRDWYRSAPEIIQLYALNIHPANIRAKVRQQFEKNSKIDDLETVDVLLLKGHQEFQETMNVWKMESHVATTDPQMRFFREEEAPPQPTTFLEKFYQSRDESHVLQAS